MGGMTWQAARPAIRQGTRHEVHWRRDEFSVWCFTVFVHFMSDLSPGLFWSGPGWDGELRFPSCSDTGPPFVAFTLVGTLWEFFFVCRIGDAESWNCSDFAEGGELGLGGLKSRS